MALHLTHITDVFGLQFKLCCLYFGLFWFGNYFGYFSKLWAIFRNYLVTLFAVVKCSSLSVLFLVIKQVDYLDLFSRHSPVFVWMLVAPFLLELGTIFKDFFLCKLRMGKISLSVFHFYPCLMFVSRCGAYPRVDSLKVAPLGQAQTILANIRLG